MRVRIRPGVRRRPDRFGGVVYVPQRDDFFACSRDVFAFLETVSDQYSVVGEEYHEAARSLAEKGVVETQPQVAERAYSGPSFLGVFPEIPTVTEPLVLNTFATAYCPLRCKYCHADDLMQTFRAGEEMDDLERVIATAKAVPSIVAVITGGDPLTRPDRAKRLIEALADRKALVLDTSGVGDIEALIPTLVEHQVHVRVSLDSIAAENDSVRPPNPKYAGTTNRNASRVGAERTIRAALNAGLPVTVQTVISSYNEQIDAWRDLREWLMSRGVRHWVMHVAISGGKARRVEEQARRKQTRLRGILPSSAVRAALWTLMSETTREKMEIDIRCTDTDTTPNSVLLVGSKGDLYTEGYAHKGKVTLYEAARSRPDLLRDLWPYVDKFGHAKRYFNWNPWAFEHRSIEELCVDIPLPEKKEQRKGAFVETEVKHRIIDAQRAQQILRAAGFVETARVWQRDEYFDDRAGTLAEADFVVRLREHPAGVAISLKGPRYYGERGEHSRIELEVPAADAASVRSALAERDLRPSWFLEKRRVDWKAARGDVVSFDEIPDIGWYLEIEGTHEFIDETRALLAGCLGEVDSRNYAEIYRATMAAAGIPAEQVLGAEFAVLERG